MMAWDALPDVRSPAGRSISDLLETGPRRQSLPGFDPVYRDFVDYIIRCTHRIWEEKNVGLCGTHYSDDCVMHTLAGPQVGAEVVTQNTINALAGCADRKVIGEDVIWSHDADNRLYSSHRIVSRSTHGGNDAFMGAATMRGTGVMTIADCACRENKIVEEWLVRDNLRAAWQVGLDPWDVARAQATGDQSGDTARHQWRSDAIAATRSAPDCAIAPDHPAAPIVAALSAAWRDDQFGDAAQAFSPTVELRWPSNRNGFGRGYWVGCMMQLRGALHDVSFCIEHVAARPLPHGDIAVALRWSLAGTHKGHGVWGAPTGRELYVLGISHYILRDDLIIEDATVFDELAILRQICSGLGA